MLDALGAYIGTAAYEASLIMCRCSHKCLRFDTKLISSLRNCVRNRWREEAASTIFPKRRSVFFLTILGARPPSNQN